jgi:hypothetical protein
MTEGDRTLPTPPRRRFGRSSPEEAGTAAPLTSDKMALAAAEGRLEEFFQRELPEGDHARNLALMMMGLSGLMPEEVPGPPATAQPPGPARPSPDAQPLEEPHLPPEVLAAVQQGDVASLTGLLRAEHEKRFPPAAAADEAPPLPASPAAPPATGRPGIDAAIIDELLRIAADNDVTVDWLTLRAVKLYVEEHRRTGRL